MAQQSERLAAILEPVVRDLGLELYDVEVGGSNRARTLRVLVDRDGGVDLEAITSATEALAPVLDQNPDVAAALPGSYLLEVSSPGLERPLRTPAHFRRALEDHPWREWAEVQESTHRMPGGQSRWTGGKDLSWEPVRLELRVELLAERRREAARDAHVVELALGVVEAEEQ